MSTEIDSYGITITVKACYHPDYLGPAVVLAVGAVVVSNDAV